MYGFYSEKGAENFLTATADDYQDNTSKGYQYWPVGSVVERAILVREVWGSIPRPVRSDTVSPPLQCHFGAVLPRR